MWQNECICCGDDNKKQVSMTRKCQTSPQCDKQETQNTEGAQWLSGRVLDLRPRGLEFKSRQRHCIEVLEQDTFILA